MLVSKGKQRGDQTLTAEDGLVAPSFETKIQSNKHTDKHAKKNDGGVAVGKKGSEFILTYCGVMSGKVTYTFIIIWSIFFSTVIFPFNRSNKAP